MARYAVYSSVCLKILQHNLYYNAKKHVVFIRSRARNAMVYLKIGVRRGAVGSGTALQVGSSWVRFMMVSSVFFIDIILPAEL